MAKLINLENVEQIFTVAIKLEDIACIVRGEDNIQVFTKWHLNDDKAVGYKVYSPNLDDTFKELTATWEYYLENNPV